MRYLLLLTSLVLMLPVHGDWRGNIALESRLFSETGDFGQDKEQFSLKIEPEYFHQGDNSLFTVQVFAREDSLDDERSHADLRELSWLFYGDTWEFKVGVSKVFWGVAESDQLVDIINQTDAVENVDGEDKLGQPMLNLTLIRDWGSLDLFVLPYFRERTFPGPEGRFRAPVRVDDNLTTYASSEEQNRIDGAIRWSTTLGDWDMGLAHFSGTSREPRLEPVFTETGELVLSPHYTTIDQTSIDVQATIDSWLWKLELISNSGFDVRRYTAAVFGFEYSFYDINFSGIDLGIIAEYQYDDREFDYAGQRVLDSLVIGTRLALNDEQSSELLIGVGLNEEDNAFWNIEASRRIGSNWRLTIEGRILSGIDDNAPEASPFYAVRNDSFVMLELGYFF